MDTKRIPPAGDPFTAHPTQRDELLEAARFAVRWFREREMHAPPDTAFGGEAEVEARLRRAIVRAAREA